MTFCFSANERHTVNGCSLHATNCRVLHASLCLLLFGSIGLVLGLYWTGWQPLFGCLCLPIRERILSVTDWMERVNVCVCVCVWVLKLCCGDVVGKYYKKSCGELNTPGSRLWLAEASVLGCLNVCPVYSTVTQASHTRLAQIIIGFSTLYQPLNA